MKNIFFIFIAILLFSCINRPEIELIPYPTPEIISASFASGEAEIEIFSIINEDDFIGYDIYLSQDQDLISLIESTNILPISNESFCSLFVSRQETHLDTFTFHGLTNGIIYYTAIVPVGSNEFWAAIQNTSEKITFQPSAMFPLFPRAEGDFTMQNYLNTTNQSAMIIQSNIIEVTASNPNENSITASIYFSISSINSVYYPVIKAGASNSGLSSIQDLGYVESMNDRTSMPTNGYFQRNKYIIIHKNHMYAVKENNFYYKILILESPSPATILSDTNAALISGKWALQSKTNENRF